MYILDLNLRVNIGRASTIYYLGGGGVTHKLTTKKKSHQIFPKLNLF